MRFNVKTTQISNFKTFNSAQYLLVKSPDGIVYLFIDLAQYFSLN